MSNTWQGAYDELKGFVAQHPSIEIRPDTVSIPSDIRSDFYRLFDSLRENFVRGNFSSSLEKALTLSANHERIRSELTASLSAEEIDVRAGIKEMLLNSMGHLIKLLFDPLFDLLMGKINPVAFEEISTRKLQSAFDSFFQQAYESWLMLSLMQLVAPDEAYIVPIGNDIKDECDTNIGNPGACPEQMPPDAVQTHRFSLDTTPFVSFMVPKVIVHSKRLNLFVSFVQEFRDVPLRVRYLNQNVEWYRISELREIVGPGRLWPDVAIYLAKQPNDLILVSDNRSLARPDMIVNIVQQKDLSEPGKSAILKSRDKAFAPRLGSFVICPELLPEADVETFKQQFRPVIQRVEVGEAPVKTDETQVVENLPAEPAPIDVSQRNIELIGVGYEAGKLESIASIITQSQRYAELTSNPDKVA